MAQAGLPGSVGGLSPTCVLAGSFPSPLLPALTPIMPGTWDQPPPHSLKSTGSEDQLGLNPGTLRLLYSSWALGSLDSNWQNLWIKELKSECLMVGTLMLISAHSARCLCVSHLNPQTTLESRYYHFPNFIGKRAEA